jgi:hypothetical protein
MDVNGLLHFSPGGDWVDPRAALDMVEKTDILE